MADKTRNMAVNAPRALNIKGQPHQLSYITPQEAGILRALGGSGKPGPMGIPSFYDEGDDYTGPGGDSFADATGNQTTSISMEDLYSGPSFSSDDGDSGSVTGPTSRPPKSGLTKDQFENRFGITNRNPYGQTGFAKFFDKFSKALGGKGVDYRQQFRDLDRLMGRDPGDSLARFKKQQYDLYRNPKIAPDGRITSGGIDQANRGTYQGPIEMVTREMGPGEQLVRTGIGAVPFAGSFLSQMGTEDPYLASRVTPEMRERENRSLAEQLIGGLNLGDTIESIANKGSSMIERLQGLASGNQQPAQAPVASGPVMGSRDPSREGDALTQSIALGPTNEDEFATMAMMPAEMLPAEDVAPQGPMMPAESDPRLSNNTVANMLMDPSPEPKVFDLPVTEIDTVSGPLDRYTIDTQTGRPMDEIEAVTGPTPEEIDTISFQSLFPSEVLDSIAAKPPELVNAPNEGLGRQGGLRFFAPEPELGPYEQSQAPTRDLRDSTALAGLDYPTLSELMTLGADLMTGGGPRTSIPLGEGTLNFNLNRDNPGVEYRRQLQGKDLGLGELLSFLDSRRT